MPAESPGRTLAEAASGWVRNKIRGEVAIERRERFRIGRRGPEADVAIWTDQNHAARLDAGAGGIDVRVVRNLHEPGPASAQLRERRGVCDGSKNEHVVRRSAKPRPVGVALPWMRIGVGPVSPEVGDERAPRIVDVDHGACVANQRGRDRVCVFGWHLSALPDGVRDADDRTVYLVRDVEDVAVRDHALHRVVVEQRLTCIAAQDERRLPREVVAVMQPRVEPLPAERTREVGGVADQEAPSVRQTRDDPPVHPKLREPGDVGGPRPPPEPYLYAGGDIFGGYRLYPLFQVLES